MTLQAPVPRRTSRLGAYVKAALVAGLLGAPAMAEAHARARLDDSLDHRGLQARSLHIGPLGVRASSVQLRAGSKSIHLDEVRIRPGLDGVHIEIRGARLSPAALGATASRPVSGSNQQAQALGAWAPVETLRSVARRARGVPISVQVRGPVDLSELNPRADWVDARIEAIDARIDAQGGVTGEVRAQLRVSERPYQLELQFDSDTKARAPATLSGHLDAAKLGQIEFRVEAKDDRFAALVDLEQGQLRFDGHGLVDSKHAGATLGFSEFPVGGVGAFLDQGTKRVGLDVAWQELRLDGRLALSREGGGWRGDARDMALQGLSVQSPRLARQAVRFDTLGIEADLRRDTSAVSAVLTLSHGQAAVVFSGQQSEAGLSLRAQLAPLACQDLLDSAPRGLFNLLEGMQMSGEVEGHASLDLQWHGLHNWVAEQELAKAEGRMPDETVPEPGELTFEFPLLDSCRVTREAPGLSVQKLNGAYRHRFRGGDGSDHQRVLATGAPNFAPMALSRNFSRAFTILEDARFWVHDGFDREHIERALWHDLAVGAMARGASTITQQTARNLWLGLDRSVSRKLQEAFLAARLENEVGKRRIMEIYINIIELGPEVYGVEQAAQFYFGRGATELNLLESLHIAALAPSPVRLAKRFESGEIDTQWREHLQEQLRRLRIHGFLTREQYREAMKLDLALLNRAKSTN